MADPSNPALIADLGEAASHFAVAALNCLSTEAKAELADLIATHDAAVEVRVQLEPFAARVMIVPANGRDTIEVGCFA